MVALLFVSAPLGCAFADTVRVVIVPFRKDVLFVRSAVAAYAALHKVPRFIAIAVTNIQNVVFDVELFVAIGADFVVGRLVGTAGVRIVTATVAENCAATRKRSDGKYRASAKQRNPFKNFHWCAPFFLILYI